MNRCSIIPPYLLDVLARSDDPAIADRAQRTLALDTHLRRDRLGSPEARTPTTTRKRRRASAASALQREIHDAQQTENLPGELVRSEGQPASSDTAVNEAYDGLGDTYALWMESYGRNSLDGKGLPLIATVHYAKGYDNAFWDGSQMVFGDGDGEIFLSFTRSLDVIGHELAHGVTQYTSGLTYQDQAGALNESVSDVFGVLVKQRTLGQSAEQADWLIGAELLAPGVQGKALRSMAEPGTAYDDPRLGKDPQPAHMRDYVDTADDNGGVHINSGIPNKAFHLVATTIGGNAWEAPGQIWVDTITGDIKADCDFVTFAGLTLAAARARYGDDSAEARAVESAWVSVGVTGSPDAATSEQSSESPAPADTPDAPPAGAPAGPLTLRRTGGIAGIVQERQVSLDELPRPDASAWRSLLASNSLTALALQPMGHPDAFHYAVRCDEPPLDVTIAEPALPDHTRALFERTLRP